MSVTDIMIILNTAIKLVIALSIVEKARRSGMRTLYLLTSVFITSSFVGLFNLESIKNDTLAWSISGITQFLILIFIEQTFYKDKKSPVKIFMIITTPISILAVLIPVYSATIYAVNSTIIAVWFIIVARNAYNEIKDSKFIEDWAKKRYKLIILYSLLDIIANIAIPVLAANPDNTLWMLIVFLSLDGSLIVQFLAWVMPKRIMKFYNRNYIEETQESIEEVTEEELLKQFAAGG